MRRLRRSSELDDPQYAELLARVLLATLLVVGLAIGLGWMWPE